MTGGGKTNMLDVLRERITAMDDAILVQLNAAGSGDELSWAPLAAVTAAGLQAGNPDLRGRITGALQWARHLIGERAQTAAHTGDSVFQPTRTDPAVVVMIDEIDETGNIEGATKLLEFLASKQRKSAVILVLAGQRATVQWTGGSGVRVNLSTVVYGMLARDSEARHAVGAENELPDISGYSRGQAGYFGIYSVRQKKLTQRGRTFWIGTLRDQQDKIIARRDPAARPALKGAGEITAPAPAAPREQAGSGLRERLARVREVNEGRPLPAGPGALPVVPGVPAHDIQVLLRLLAAPEGTTAALAGVALGKSKSLAHEYLTALRDHNIARLTGGGRGSRFRLCRAEPEPVLEPQQYTTIEALAELVLSGVVAADDEQREILGQAWQTAHGHPYREQAAHDRPHLTLLQGGGGATQ